MIDATLTMVGPHGPVRGGRSGPVRGGGAIPVLDVRHTLVSPFDPVTEQRTGKRRHSTVVVLKEVDRATPALLAAWGRNEVLTTGRLDVFGADGLGRRTTAYTIELRHAFVVGVSLLTADAPMPREEGLVRLRGDHLDLGGRADHHDGRVGQPTVTAPGASGI